MVGNKYPVTNSHIPSMCSMITYSKLYGMLLEVWFLIEDETKSELNEFYFKRKRVKVPILIKSSKEKIS